MRFVRAEGVAMGEAANSTDTAPVIAARDSARRVDIGVQTLNNQEGDGANSNLTVRGSTVQSGDTTTLAADNQVRLLAAANTAGQTSDQKSSSGSLGVTVGKHTGFTVSASQGSGDGNGQH